MVATGQLRPRAARLGGGDLQAGQLDMATVLEQKISELGLDPSEAVFHKNAILARAAGRYTESRFSSVVDCWNNFGLLPANCPATPGGIIVAGLFRTVKHMYVDIFKNIPYI